MVEERFVGERLAVLRQQKGVSAREMSLSLGQSENYINKIENHKALPSMPMFFYLCDNLGVTPSEFLDTENKNPVVLRELLSEFQKMDAKTLDLWLALARQINQKR